MTVLIRFKINVSGFSGPTYEEVAQAMSLRGRGNGNEPPYFRVWGNPSFPESTVVECLRAEYLADALQTVNAAIDAAGVRRYCTGGDLHLPRESF